MGSANPKRAPVTPLLKTPLGLPGHHRVSSRPPAPTCRSSLSHHRYPTLSSRQHPTLVSLRISHRVSLSTPLLTPSPPPGMPFPALHPPPPTQLGRLELRWPPPKTFPGFPTWSPRTSEFCAHIFVPAPHIPTHQLPSPTAVCPSERPVSPTRLRSPKGRDTWVHP